MRGTMGARGCRLHRFGLGRRGSTVSGRHTNVSSLNCMGSQPSGQWRAGGRSPAPREGLGVPARVVAATICSKTQTIENNQDSSGLAGSLHLQNRQKISAPCCCDVSGGARGLGGIGAASSAGAGACNLRKSTCWDNAVAESFFATLKVELVHDAAWPTRAGGPPRALRELSVSFWDQRQNRGKSNL